MRAVSGRAARRQSQFEQIEEMIALEALQRERGLTDAESERLGFLLLREARRARYRPARIAKLRRELELLEMLERAERGAAALALPGCRDVEMARGSDGRWSAPFLQREAA